MVPKRVAVIGAGASGLPAIKTCLDEGLAPVCFERTDGLGGLWRYTDEPVEGQGCVMKSTCINTSKEMMSYSDFPIPDNYPIYMHNTQVYEYFKLYAAHFGLEKYIQYSTEVVHVRRSQNYDISGQWEVVTRKKQTGDEQREVFDAVLVCTGHHADKHVPTFPGINEYKGKVLHSLHYKRPDGFEDKRVLVIGVGNSGGDVAVELSRIASQVFLSTRRGVWIFNRVSNEGYPFDMMIAFRLWRYVFNALPSLADRLIQWKLNKRINHDLYRLRPDCGPLNQTPLINDDMPNRIICGAIKIKTGIKRFTSTGAEFVDGTFEDNIDLVILATGYSFGFPFIEKQVILVNDNQVQLYKYMYPPELQHHTLAFIGCVQPKGAIMPVSELQCRLATRVLKGDAVLPSKDEMWRDIRRKEAAMAKRFVKSRSHTILVDYVQFMDELARLVGCSVDYCDLLRKDPVLALKVIFGPVTPYTFRLCGPGQWAGARDAVMNQWRRLEAPLQTRPLPPARRGLTDTFLTIAVLFLLSILCFVYLLL